MVATTHKRAAGATRIAFAAFGITAALATASPALANAASANTDMAVDLDSAQSGAVTSGDEQFRQLFSRWEALDAVNRPSASPPIFPAPSSVAPSSIRVSTPSGTPLESGRATSGYGMRNHPVLGGRRRHNGIDLAAPTGTPIYATADGVVSRANRFSSYGLYISIEHDNSYQTRFAHLSRIAVRAGDQVRKGDLIGYVGSTGRSTGPHLHYEVRIAGKSVNPMRYMNR